MSSSHADASNSREEVVRDPSGTTFRVRAVKRGMWLRGDVEDTASSLSDLVVTLVINFGILLFAKSRADAKREWKIGVFRQGRATTLRLIHKELLPEGVSPEARMQELGTHIRAGNLDWASR